MQTRQWKILAIVLISAVFGYLWYARSSEKATPEQIATLVPDRHKHSHRKPKFPMPADPAQERSSPKPAEQPTRSELGRPPPSLDQVRALFRDFENATTHAQALDAIRRGLAQGIPSAMDLRMDLVTVCGLPLWLKDVVTSTAWPDSAHKKQFDFFCAGYDDVTTEAQAVALENDYRNRSARTRIRNLLDDEWARSGDAALTTLEMLLKQENDPIVIHQIFLEAAYASRKWPIDIRQKLFGKVYQGYNLLDLSSAIEIAGDMAYCELSGGCGPSSLMTLARCAPFGYCPPNAGLRDFHEFKNSPFVMLGVETILARWRALR